MIKFWICVLLVASIGIYSKAQEPEDPDEYGDYFDYDNFEDLLKKVDEEIENLNSKTNKENGLYLEKQLEQFKETDEKNVNASNESKGDSLKNIDHDYLVEDNRDKYKDEERVDNDAKLESNDKPKDSINETDNNDIGNRAEPDDPNVDYEKKTFALWGDDSVAPLPVPEESEIIANKPILEETQKLLEEDADNFEEEIKKEIGQVDIKAESQPNMEEIVDETKQLLADNDDLFDDDTNDLIDDAGETDDSTNDKNKEATNEKDKAYADLNADLDKLFETLDKLRNDDTNSDVEDLDKALEEADNSFEDNNDFNDNSLEGSEELVEDDKDDNPIDLDKLLQDILSEVDMKAEDTAVEDLQPLINDALSEPNPDDAFEKDAESLDSKLEPILYVKDALADIELTEVETFKNNEKNGNVNASKQKEEDVKTALVDDLSSAEMDDLVSQFSVLHSEDLDMHSKTFEKSVAPEHITLKVDEPTIITSPNYPGPYPVNSTVDWIIEGVGEGIELNITEFAVNGALGDYLLIKPGGVDDSGHEGILFTYRLSTARRYRFMDVDRVFMRFESQLGMQFFRGFVISAKMIAPISEGPEPVPEPEAVVTPPHSTTTITLAVPVPSIDNVKEDLRLILADMAEEYIRDNDLDPGLNSTSEVTQITGVGLCPITWPGYEDCAALTFGVSLVYEQEGYQRLNSQDLQEMWRTYVNRDPFALRLSRLSITEFYPPDSTAMTAWLVIAGGVVISMMMLAFVLWRFSCFEDYTRMKAYSDTDSLHNEKRNLDLYPTPHQTLPPLYAENEYKWHEEDSTRVDMGGLANRSFAGDNMYDFESDEDVIPTRDRNGAVAQRDISNV